MKRKTIGLVLSAVLLLAAALAIYYYYKAPPDIKKTTARFEKTAAALLTAFQQDEAAANAKYLDQVITVEGIISKIDLNPESPAVFLETGDMSALVTCSFYKTELPALQQLKAGNSVKIKGVCTGMLMDIVLNKCSIAD